MLKKKLPDKKITEMKSRLLITIILMITSLHLAKGQDTTASCPEGGIEANESNTFFNVFPNPSDGTFQIVYGSNNQCPPEGWGGILVVHIMNSDYETVYLETIPVFEGDYNKTIDLSTLKKGIYTVELVCGKQKRVRREVLM